MVGTNDENHPTAASNLVGDCTRYLSSDVVTGIPAFWSESSSLRQSSALRRTFTLRVRRSTTLGETKIYGYTSGVWRTNCEIVTNNSPPYAWVVSPNKSRPWSSCQRSLLVEV